MLNNPIVQRAVLAAAYIFAFVVILLDMFIWRPF